MKVYVAGKIGKNEHGLFDRLRDYHDYLRDDCQTFTPLFKEDFEYVGPFFIGDDYGSCHGEYTHGRGANVPSEEDWNEVAEESRVVVQKCLSWLRKADVMFVWLDKNDAYGTIVEIGYAKALGVPIFIAVDTALTTGDFPKDIWFALTCSDSWSYQNDPASAWKWFAEKSQFTPEELLEERYILELQNRKASVRQRKYVQDLLEKCSMTLTVSIDDLTHNQAGVIIAKLAYGKEPDGWKSLLEEKVGYQVESGGCVYTPTEITHLLKIYYGISLTVQGHSKLAREHGDEDSRFYSETTGRYGRRLYSQLWIDYIVDILRDEEI